MDVRGRVAVVTGGAGGIGAGLCRALAAHGARAVVVADVDESAAQRVAQELAAAGADAIPVRTDVGSESDVRELVGRVEDAYGVIDLFCANAGIMVAGGVDVGDDDWARIWRVNVNSHLYAARAVLPGMLERGEGYLLHTASAAGLLTQLGALPYTVTKHAVVALAEWLSITYGDAGIRVSCLCPQAVRTAMLGAGSAGEEGPRRAPGAGSALSDGIMRPDEVADAVIAGLAAETFLILPHPQVATYERRRADDRDRWLRGMRRAQAALAEGIARSGRA